MKIIARYAALPLVLCAAPALAADEPSQPRLMTDLVACRDIGEAAARLACFDRTSAKFAEAAAAKDLVVLDREDVRKTKRSLFGFNLPKLPFFSGEKEDEQPEFAELNTTIESVRSLGYGKFVIRIAEGANWQTTEPTPRLPQAGKKVNIRQGAMGSYFLKAEGGRSVKAMRVN